MAVNHNGELTTLNIVDHLQVFAPRSAGNYSDLANLTIECGKDIFLGLLRLLTSLDQNAGKIWLTNDFCESVFHETKEEGKNQCDQLRQVFNAYGSDKSSSHNYELLYGRLFPDVSKVKAILEIGLGTNNTSIVSHMGSNGIPGASLRAFRDVFPQSILYGADIDKDILFIENRILASFHVDQTNPSSLSYFVASLPNDLKLDLVIDDGLHCPFANINVLTSLLPKVKQGGWIVIEDISEASVSIWQLVQALMQSYYPCWVVKTKSVYMFLLHK
jgi:hypothetical protein